MEEIVFGCLNFYFGKLFSEKIQRIRISGLRDVYLMSEHFGQEFLSPNKAKKSYANGRPRRSNKAQAVIFNFASFVHIESVNGRGGNENLNFSLCLFGLFADALLNDLATESM